MVEWSRDYYIDPATTGLNAVYRPTSGSDDNDDPSHINARFRAPSMNVRPSESSKVSLSIHSVHYGSMELHTEQLNTVQANQNSL